jgi:hypothetical protein
MCNVAAWDIQANEPLLSEKEKQAEQNMSLFINKTALV